MDHFEYEEHWANLEKNIFPTKAEIRRMFGHNQNCHRCIIVESEKQLREYLKIAYRPHRKTRAQLI